MPMRRNATEPAGKQLLLGKNSLKIRIGRHGGSRVPIGRQHHLVKGLAGNT